MSGQAPHPEGAFARWAPPRADAAMTVGLMLVCGLEALGHRGVVGPLLSVALVGPLAWRRRRPFAVFVLIIAVAAVQWLLVTPLVADVALLIALYTVAADCPRGRAVFALAIVEIGVVLAVLRWGAHLPLVVGALLSALAVAAAVIGDNVSARRAHLASLEDRAVRLEHERDQEGRLAAAAERTRIAREMHDVVAHNLSVMIALADGAAFAVSEQPQRASDAMTQVGETGRQALTEMRRLLGVLRDGEGEPALAPQPGLAQIEPLARQVRAAGLPVRLETNGTPPAVGPGAELTIYRLVQEALTNTLKHADPEARATVRLCYEGAAVEVEVVDDGRLQGDPSAGEEDGGQGLAGMQERVAVYGGTVEAGPRVEGGWRVHARLVG